MRLALCLFNYDSYGGLSKDFIAIANEAVTRGHMVDVYTQSWQGVEPKGLNIHIICPRSWTSHGRSKRFASLAIAAMTARGYDCLLGFNRMPGLDYYFCADSSFIQKARSNHGALYQLTWRYRTFAWLERGVFSQDAKTKVFNLAPALKAEYQGVHGIAGERFIDVPPMVDIMALDKARENTDTLAFRRVWNIERDELLMLMVGSSFNTKGVDRSIKAFASLSSEQQKRSRLVIVGQGKRAPLQRLAKTEGVEDRVVFIGASDQVFCWMLSADLLLHPSRVEAAGGVIVEALACGLPVLATDSCGFAFHLVQAEAGLLIANSPYRQGVFDELLQRALAQRGAWSINAKRYALATSLDGRAQKILEELELGFVGV